MDRNHGPAYSGTGGRHGPEYAPEHILPKTNASPGLLAHLVTGKYVDSLPLYRQEAVFERHGVRLPRATQAAWMIGLNLPLQPLLNLMDERIRSCGYVRIDETRVQVLNSDKAPSALHWMWVRVAGPTECPIRRGLRGVAAVRQRADF